MLEGIQKQIRLQIDKKVVVPVFAVLVGTCGWLGEEAAGDIATTAFERARKYGEPPLGHSLMRRFLPPWVKGEFDRAISLGIECFKLRQSVRRGLINSQTDNRN